MNKDTIRVPQQKRSIEKKNKIIKAGYDLICQKGYYNTNTAEIAKAAGVSTGIVYSYFKDKHDILLASLENFAQQVTEPLYADLALLDISIKTQEDLIPLLDRLITHFYNIHINLSSAHRELFALTNTDDEINQFFISCEEDITKKITALLLKSGFPPAHLAERVNLSYNLIENYCHEAAFRRHDFLDYDIMKTEIIRVVICLLAAHLAK